MQSSLKILISQTIQSNKHLQHFIVDCNTVSYDDKVYILTKTLNKNQLVCFAILCAQSVQHIFEEKYPENKSVANLLNYLSEIKDFNNLSHEQRQEIARLRDATYTATYAAAYYAANAAYYAADAAAADAAAAYATYAAASNAANAAKNRKQQEELNLTFLKKIINM